MGRGRDGLFRVGASKRLERVVKRVPGGEPAAWRSASRYVASRSRSGALATVEMLLERGHEVSVDLFGERVSDPAVADEVLEHYLALVAALPPPPAEVWLSVDLPPWRPAPARRPPPLASRPLPTPCRSAGAGR